MERLFERFYQVTGSRTCAGALAIVSRLSTAMDAQVAALLDGGVLRIVVVLKETEALSLTIGIILIWYNSTKS